MSKRRYIKYVLAGLVILIGLDQALVTPGQMSYWGLKKSLGTGQEPLPFMAHSIKPGMTRSQVTKIIRGYTSLESRPPAPYAPGGTHVYTYEYMFARRWKFFGEYGRIYVQYDADGRVHEAFTDLED